MIRVFIVFAVGLLWPLVAVAQQSAQTSKIKSPGEIAAESRNLAEKNEGCRRQAKEAKLTGLKRRRFIRDCAKSN
jgi:hypothetical protein